MRPRVLFREYVIADAYHAEDRYIPDMAEVGFLFTDRRNGHQIAGSRLLLVL